MRYSARMQTEIPSAGQVREQLLRLGYAQVQHLSKLSGVPFTTLWKVRTGETENPRLESVRAFMPHVNAASEYQRETA